MNIQDKFPLNVPGDFYTTGVVDPDGNWMGECLMCNLPESCAPTLFAPLTDSNSDTYFIKQPETEIEVAQAVEAMSVCCVTAVRYSGKDPDILSRANPEACDYEILLSGAIVPKLKQIPKSTKQNVYESEMHKFSAIDASVFIICLVIAIFVLIRTVF